MHGELKKIEELERVLQEHLSGDAEFLQIVPSGDDWLLIYRTPERKPVGYRTTHVPGV